MEAVFQIVGIDCGGIYIFDEETGLLNLVAHRELSPEFIHMVSSYEPDTPNAQIVRNGQPLYAHFLDLPLSSDNVLVNEDLKAIAILPIKHEGKVIGACNLASHVVDRFTEDVQVKLELIANQIGGTFARIRAESALIESQRNLQTLFDTLDDFLFILDMNGFILKTNPIVQNRLGYTSEELSRMTFPDLHPADQRNEVKAFISDILTKPISFSDISILARDGTTIPVETKFTIGSWANRPVMFCISRDITERKKSEDALKESEQLYRSLINVLPEGVALGDLFGNITFISPQLLNIYGATSNSDAIGSNALQWIAPESRTKAKKNILNLLKNKISSDNEYILMRSDGTRFPGEITGALLTDEAGKPKGLVTVVRDISERRQIEQERQNRLQRIQKQQAAIIFLATHESLSSGKVEAYSQMATEIIAGVMNVRRTSFWLFSENEQEFICYDLFDLTTREHTSGNIHKVDDYPSYFYNLHTNLVIDASEAYSDPRTCEFREKYLEPLRIVSILDASVRISGKLVGIICFEHVGEPRKWLDDEITFASQVADQFAGVLLNKERKLSEKALLESEELYRKLVNTVPDVIIRTDIGGNIIFINDIPLPFSKFLNKNDFIGKNIISFVAPEDIERAVTKFRLTLEKPQGPLEYKLLIKNNVRIECELNGNVLRDVDGIPYGRVYILRDITERKRNERDLERYHLHLEELVKERTVDLEKANILLTEEIAERKRAEEELEKAMEATELANDAKRQFLATMSHEIRTPMNAILGFSNLLNKQINDPQMKSYIDSIHSSGKSLLALINDILDLSKVEAGKMELNPHFIDAVQLFKNLEDIFSMKVSKKGIDLMIELDPNLPYSIYIDEIRMKQVLINLLGNAIKFTDQGYVKLSVFASNRKIIKKGNKQKELTDLIIKVSDTGIGIPKEDQGKIFQLFTQVRRQDYDKYGGTGLGLTISKTLVEMMNGKITVESELNKGSIFTITLLEVPVSGDILQKESEVLIDPDKIEFKKAGILIVDDIENHRKYIKEALRTTALDIIEAKNGQEAFDLIHDHDLLLVITDIQMPVMDGVELLKRIRKDKKIRQIPVVAVTASAMQPDIDKIKQYDFNGLLIKPISPESLYNELLKFIPHTISEDQAKEDQTDELMTVEIKQYLPEIIECLDGEIMNLWKSIDEHLSIEDMSLFGDKIFTLGQKYNVRLLIDYGKQIKRSVDTFDVEIMMNCITDFPKIIDKIKMLK
jgi:PAS domain S-box-containing protein